LKLRRSVDRKRSPWGWRCGRSDFASRFWVVIALIGITWSCAGSRPAPLDPADLANRVPKFEERALRRPNDPVSLCDLGVTLYLLGNTERALPLLRETILYDPTRLPAALIVTREHWTERRLQQADQLLDVQRPVTELERRLVRSFRWQISDARARERALAVARRRTSGIVDNSSTIVVFDFEAGLVSRETQALALASAELFREELRKELGDRLKFDLWARHVRQSLERLDAGEGRTEIEPLASVTTVRGLQQRLSLLSDGNGVPYFGGQTDDVLGRETVAAIKRFQSDHGLPIDGIVGPTTRAVLAERLNQAFVQAPPAARSRAAAEAARLAGVRYALDGQFWEDSEGRVQVRLDWIDALDDAVIQTWAHDLPVAEVSQLASVLAAKVLEHPLLGAAEADPVPTPVQIDSLGFAGFGEGLRQERLGRWGDAAVEYADVLKRLPTFWPAAWASGRLAIHGDDWNRFIDLSVRDALDR